ncbi:MULTISPECIES: tetratricopeptide repeat protein [Hymenobacter]|uniref:Tetratricopeptide repeat protein n=2 Tax=Hymenobacter TaxID=89966 RepID=A0ABS6X2D5_9BACT|nr:MULTISPECIES: tetratricopeptide repeat protein [Hymenobacter]MBO3270385.1 tetratricopeptide repeat protein [Hymenobacter defluvii]MBW3129996.1 tetratricopeptide repeat protein [Hymenobacter profundi]QNE41618.1 tetratricopeptide repeat protein [Hymenobacter sp. NBH84]
MTLKPWKLSLLAALSVYGSSAVAQNVQSAQKAIELERYGQARADLLRQPQSPEANYELGRLYQFRDMPDSAAYYFNKGANDPKSALSMVAAGRAALAQGKTTEAEARFDEAVKKTKGKDADILTKIAQAYAESDEKNITKALTYVEAAHKANKEKDTPALMVARGDIYLKTAEGGGNASGSYARALLADPNNVQAYYRQGQLNVRARNYNEARTAFEKAISLDPNYAPAYRDLAETYYYAGQYDLALQTFQKYIDRAERTPQTNATYAAFLFLTKKYPETVTEAQKVLAVDPKNVAMNRLVAYSLYEDKKNEEAMAAMQKYMSLVPANKLIADDYVYLGKMQVAANKFDEGIASIKKGIEMDPQKAGDLQNDLAQAYLTKKDYPMAVATYKTKIANQIKANGSAELTDQIRLANAYEYNKQYAEADSLYAGVLTARPEYAAGYLMRARVNSNLDPNSTEGKAKPHYEKFLEMMKANPEDAARYKNEVLTANKYLGYYYYQKGDKAASLPYWQAALAIDPNDNQAKTAVNSISGAKTARK